MFQNLSSISRYYFIIRLFKTINIEYAVVSVVDTSYVGYWFEIVAGYGEELGLTIIKLVCG